MVNALRESHRVLTSTGVLIDVRPVIAPIVVEVVIADHTVWAQPVETYSAPDHIAAADAAIQHASREWLVFETSVRFIFEIYCDHAAELRVYAEARKLRGGEIPYEELEKQRRESGVEGEPARLRRRRPWMLTTYRKQHDPRRVCG